MFHRLKTRFSRFIDNCIKQRIDTIASVAASRIDIGQIAMRVPFDRERFIDEIMDRVKTGQAVEYDRLAECIDPEELAKQFDTADLAGEMDYSSLAGEIDMSLLAREFDATDIAGEISISSLAEEFDEDELAEKVVESLDYKSLARALLAEIKAEPVTVRPSA